MSHRDWAQATAVRMKLQQQWHDLFREWDVVLCPPMPTPAFPHDHSTPISGREIEIDGKEYSYFDQLVWPVNCDDPRSSRDGGADRNFGSRSANRRPNRRPIS
jgi:Asp-tRNA(Asn)/Glu-tRNA(Gln) amidotransferase A subunit family amidase